MGARRRLRSRLLGSMVLRSLVWVWLLCLALPCKHSIRSLPAKARKEATNEVCMHHEKGQEGRKWIGSGCERKFDLISIRESIGVGVPALSNFPQEQSKEHGTDYYCKALWHWHWSGAGLLGLALSACVVHS